MMRRPILPPARLPRCGDLLHLTRAASVQFLRPIMFRVIRVLDWPAYDGWCWLDGYQLNEAGDATARRRLFVQPAGVVWQRTGPTAPARRVGPPSTGLARTSTRV